MFLTQQRTILHKITCKGIGLHSGKEVTINFLPSKPNLGIIFKRTDVEGDEESIIRAKYDNVTETNLGTTISNSFGIKVSTIEHLMAAIWSSKITNLIVEIDNEEIPIMDGSAEPFIFIIESAGVKEEKEACKTLRILKEVSVEEEDKLISIKPYKGFAIEMSVEFPGVGKQNYLYDFEKLPFKENLSRARTFCYEKEVEYMRSKGLALGGSLENAVVLNDLGEPINNEGFRYKNELVRHKILDCVGDIYLSGFYNIEGYITANKTGHKLNNLLLRKLFSDTTNYTII